MRISIKNKFAIVFIIIFILGYSIISYAIWNYFYSFNENVIREDMKTLQINSREYIKQYFIINSLSFNERELQNEARELGKGLKNIYSGEVGIYSKTGQVYFSSVQDEETAIDTEELKHCLEDASSMTLKEHKDFMKISFAYPLYIEEEFIGIIRINKDYSSFYKSSWNMVFIINVTVLILFAVLCAVSYFIIYKKIKPLIKLNNALKDTAEGNYDIDISYEGNDEIGDLIEQFKYSSKKIKNQIETIEKEKEKVEQLEKYKVEFFNNVTHELKTPLTTINGYAQIINEEGFEDEEFKKKALDRIMKESKRLQHMVSEILNLSKGSFLTKEINKEEFDISELLLEVIEDMKIKADNYDLSIGYEHLIAKNIYAYKNEIKQVFINVIDNAIKYSEVASEIFINTYCDDEKYVIEVCNYTNYIDKRKVQNIFEPFVRLSKAKEGQGLGLFICKNLMEHNLGKIDFYYTEEEDKFRISVKLTFDLK